MNSILMISLLPVALALLADPSTGVPIVVDGALHHLGTAGEPEWQEFAGKQPEGKGLKTTFRASTQPKETTLFLRQSDVKIDWPVRLNGRSIGRLVPMEADLVQALAVPGGTWREGENVLEIGPPPGVDDIEVGEITIDPRPREQALNRATLDVRVTDAESGRALPCRITVVDERGALAPIAAKPDPRLAVRTGVAYTADGRARLGLRPGRYTVHATRGFEYGLATQLVTLAEGDSKTIDLAIRREVPTQGLVACDTHVHTLTNSGHGDATLEERLVALAGEGVELPVATDHNILTDYDESMQRLGLRGAFTPVIGDEVTTRRGHFNAFPFRPGDKVPNAQIEDWPSLFQEIRAGAPDRVIVLNHPRDLHSGFRPFGPENFNDVTGEDRHGAAYGFDAVEVVNSGALQSDPMRLVHDWFALCNHGQQVTAVGASDSHDVSRYIVGQGRTYIACRDGDPGRIDVAEACRNLRAGRAVVSLGLLALLTIDDRFQPGDLVPQPNGALRVTVKVLGPSWTQADRVELFANGIKVEERRLEPSSKAGEKARVEWSIPRPSRDVALVAVASGPGLTAPYWAIAKPYQPTSKEWTPRVLSITNPVRVDADGDGVWNSPRYYAQLAIEFVGTEPTRLFPFLGAFDEAVAAQAAAFCLPAGSDARGPEFDQALESAPESVQRGFDAFRESQRVRR
jgi:hypothetical protein